MNKTSEPGKLALALSVGTMMASNIVGGIIVGYLLDRWLKTSPWAITSGLILGTIGAFVGLYRIVSKLN